MCHSPYSPDLVPDGFLFFAEHEINCEESVETFNIAPQYYTLKQQLLLQ